MHKVNTILAVVITVLLTGCSAEGAADDDTGETAAPGAATQGITAQGRKIVLRGDGTWDYAEYDEPFYLHLLRPAKPDGVAVDELPACMVTKVSDGDTIWVEFQHPFYLVTKKEKVRLLGVDAPEVSSEGWLRRQADESTEYLEMMLPGRTVKLAFDYDFRDNFGRLLAYVFLEDGTCVNEQLLASGNAWVYEDRRNVFYDYFHTVLDQAKVNALGMWKGLRYDVVIEEVRNEGSREYVVLKNASKAVVSLDGWMLKDDDGFSIPLPPLDLAPEQSVIIYSGQDGIENPPAAFYPITNNIWGNDGDTVMLFSQDDELVDDYTYNKTGR